MQLSSITNGYFELVPITSARVRYSATLRKAVTMPEVTADKYVNDESIEISWAIAAYAHAEVHFNILSAVPDARILRLSPFDDVIYTTFCETFPNFDVERFTEDDIKSDDQKQLWRTFCNKFDNVVDDFNHGTLLRLNSSLEYNESNTCIVPRVQFLAIEIARNRRGINNRIHKIKPGS